MNYPEYLVINDKRFDVVLTPIDIDLIVRKVASEINKDYQDKVPVFIITLKGSIFFATDLLKHIEFDCQVETIRAVSYGDKMVSSGNVLLSQMTDQLDGKDLIIIEDIVDSGHTAQALISEMKKLNPNSVKIATFLSKPDSMVVDVPIDYIGKEITPAFVVGYGLDYAEHCRNYPALYALSEQ